MRKYKKNYTGLSISEGYGRINISRKVMNHLDYPKFIAFNQVDEDILRISVYDPEIDGFPIRVKKHPKSCYHITGADLIRYLYQDCFHISRDDPKVYSPFYISFLGESEVFIVMNNFRDYYTEERR